ncbi:fimbrial protein [Pseudomonas sp. NPDC087639]|uniref:fimbrial protein n=1 Tax=Pseudomonas sp. NPDC087639 TaxID=3364445 RepID=UPI003819E230
MSLFVGWLFLVPSVQATCFFTDNTQQSQLTINLPSTLNVTRDLPIGAELWSSGWIEAPSNVLRCSLRGNVSGVLAAGIGTAVPGFSSNGSNSVFRTNVAGIGISVFWCADSSCDPNYANATPISGLSGAANSASYNLKHKWWVRLVKVSEDLSSEPLTISGVNQVKYHDGTVAIMTIAGQTVVHSSACEVDPQSTNISISLPAVMLSDFSDSTTVLENTAKARSFEISMLCDPGVNVRYQIDGAANGNVLENIKNSGMASGIGVMLFRGDQGSRTMLPLGEKITHVKTTGQSSVKIPITAKYYKTVATTREMTGGDVSVTAVFTLFYE